MFFLFFFFVFYFTIGNSVAKHCKFSFLFFKLFQQNCQRIIRLKSLNSKTCPAALAKEVVEKCGIINKSQVAEVEQIIYYLKNRAGIHVFATQLADILQQTFFFYIFPVR